MTNFYKWQQMLPEKERVKKPEDLIVYHGPEIDEKDEFRYTINMKCPKCQCIEKCKKEHDYWTGCKDIFLEWAKEEV